MPAVDLKTYVGPADVILSWWSGVPAAIQTLFSRPTVFLGLPRPAGGYESLSRGYPLRDILAKGIPNKITPQRVCLLGFSEGCHALGAILRSADGGRIDSVIAIDGTYGRFIGPEKAHVLDPWCFTGWDGFARSAVTEKRLLIITGSQVQPRNPVTGRATHSSASEFAQALWTRVLVGPLATEALPEGIWKAKTPYTSKGGCHPQPGGAPYCNPDVVYSEALSLFAYKKGGFVILGYTNLDPTGVGDHRYQAQIVLPLVLSKFLVPRWNEAEPHAGIVCYLPGGGGGTIGQVPAPAAPAVPPPGAYCASPTALAKNYREAPTPDAVGFGTIADMYTSVTPTRPDTTFKIAMAATAGVLLGYGAAQVGLIRERETTRGTTRGHDDPIVSMAQPTRDALQRPRDRGDRLAHRKLGVSPYETSR